VVTSATVDEIKPDVFINATGGTHKSLDIESRQGKKLITGQELHSSLKKYLKFSEPQRRQASYQPLDASRQENRHNWRRSTRMPGSGIPR